MLKERSEAAAAPLSGAATAPVPITRQLDGQRVYMLYRPPHPPLPPGPRVGVLVLEQSGPHRLNVRLARALAAAGYATLAVDFRGRGESEGELHDDGQRHLLLDSMVDDARLALRVLHEVAQPERVVLFGACQAGHVAARVAALDGADGLIGAGIVNFDEHFRVHFRGVLPGLPRLSDMETLDFFETLGPWCGPLLLLHGTDDPYMEHERLLSLAEAWLGRAPGRGLEMRILEGSDHTFSSHAREQVVIAETLAWIERRFGPGYPRAWQGPPPTWEVQGRTRQDGPEAWVPLLATGALVLPNEGNTPPWRLELPEGKAFGLTEPLKRLVTLIDGHRPVAEIAARLTQELGQPVTAEQVARLLEDKLAPLGVVTPDSRGEGGEEESGMTDILIRCYEPNDRTRALLDNLTRVTRSPYNIILVVGHRSAVKNQNLALDRVRTKYAVFLDDDVLLTPGWLERLRETMDRTGAGAVSGRQLRMNGEPLASAAAVAPGQIVEIAFGGACFMFRTDLGIRFDERFVRSQWDDFDFLFQIYERGYKGYIDGRVDFYHHADPKYVVDQNYEYFVRKWTAKGLYRGLMFCRYPGGQRGYLPNFGD
ncbi:MAG TPA: glycosyltransferase [Chloroflexota bacterium]|jgi:dienelactone hydrolase|nr:glycosyltransferase [Chloroflexota bacterium]